VRVGSKAPLPQTVAQDRGLVPPKLVFPRLEGATQRGFYSQRLKEIAGDQTALDALRFARSSKVGVPPAVSCHLGEDVILA